MIDKVLPKTDNKRSSVKFDAGTSPVPFHHSLRGIKFKMGKLPETKISGDLVLKYPNTQAALQLNDDVVESLKEKKMEIASALSSYQVFSDVKRAYYVDAHRIQCTGHARFECFRAIGSDDAPVLRCFVGSSGTPEEMNAQYASFIGILSVDAAYGPSPCIPPTTGRVVTPMMIAAAIRPMLLRSLRVSVSVTDTDYGQKLAKYLRHELNVGEWKCGFDTAAKPDAVKITVKDDDNVEQEYAPRVFKVTDDMLLLTASTITTITKMPVTPANGTLFIYQNPNGYASSVYKTLPPVEFIATVDIRDQTSFKSNLGDLQAVVCKLAVFVCEKADSITGYDVARVVAAKYSHYVPDPVHEEN
jgi:hypothetical protein